MEDDAGRPEPDPVVEEPLPEPATPEQIEKAEGLIRQANLAKIRGDRDAFDKLLDEAAAVAAGSSTVQEALGDAYLERRQTRKAKDAYHRAVKLDAKNVSAERKYGECVLAIQMALDPTFGLAADDSLASGKAGVVLSFLLPGLGQIVSGQYLKGGGILGLWLAAWAWAVAVPNGFGGLGSLLGRQGPPFNPVFFVPIFIAACCWLFGISDASSRAKRFEPRSVQRPVPPVDKNFEL